MREGSAPNFAPPVEEGTVFTFQDESGDTVDLEFLGLALPTRYWKTLSMRIPSNLCIRSFDGRRVQGLHLVMQFAARRK